jgi:hypothetical protein
MSSPINLKAPAAQAIIKELKRGERLSSVQLFDHVDLPQTTINAILNSLHKRAIIYIDGWTFNKTGTPVRLYKWGAGVDSPQPVRAQKPKDKLIKPSNLPWPRCDVAASWIK